MAEFKDRLNQAMSERNMSAAELARISEVNEGAISQYRKGKYKASQYNLEKLSQTLNVSVAWLMGADVPMTNKVSKPTDDDRLTSEFVKLWEQLSPDQQERELAYLKSLVNR